VFVHELRRARRRSPRCRAWSGLSIEKLLRVAETAASCASRRSPVPGHGARAKSLDARGRVGDDGLVQRAVRALEAALSRSA
jgi:hypothetical protein